MYAFMEGNSVNIVFLSSEKEYTLKGNNIRDFVSF